MKNDIIVCLVGMSGSGKTEISKELEKMGYNIIHSYTTRQPREKNEWGHTFVHAFDQPNDIIAYTYFNNNHYWATESQCIGKGKSIYVIDPAGVSFLKENTILSSIVIFLVIDSQIAYERLQIRDGKNKAIERKLHDEEVFSTVKTDWIINVSDGSPLYNANRIADLLETI